MNQILLSILVPTYNRAVPLSKLLIQLNKECFRFSDKVEILISNNCSTDNTLNVLDEICKLPNCFPYKIFTQQENIGVSRNFRFLINQASGLFTWIIPDDDFLVENQIPSILKVLENYPYDLFVLRVGGIGDWDTIPRLSEEKVITISAGDVVFPKVAIAAGFCSSSIFCTRLLKEKIVEAEQFDNCCYPQWYCFLSIVEIEKKYMLYDEVVILGNRNMIGPTQIQSTFVLVLGRVIIWNVFRNTFTGKALKGWISKMAFIHWGIIIFGKSNDIQSFSQFKKFILPATTIFRIKPLYPIVIGISYVLYLPQIIKRKFIASSVKVAKQE